MELCPACPLNTVGGPDPAILLKRVMVIRMPVPRCKDRRILFPEPLNIGVQDRDHLISICNRQRATRAKIVLNIYNDQGGIRKNTPHIISLFLSVGIFILFFFMADFIIFIFQSLCLFIIAKTSFGSSVILTRSKSTLDIVFSFINMVVFIHLSRSL